MIEVAEAGPILVDTILHDRRHEHYGRVCDHADFNERIITGEGLEADLHHIVSRETQEQFKLRKKLFFPLAPAICHRADVPFTKVHRAQGAIEKISWKGEKNEKALKRLTEAMDGFWGDEDMSDYLADRFREMNRLDPNGFLIVEFAPFNPLTERAKPYPLELTSHDAINYAKTNNQVDWVISEFPIKYETSDGSKLDGSRFTMYFGDVLDATQVETDNDAPTVFDPTKAEQKLTIGKKTFIVRYMQPFHEGQVKRFQGVQFGHLKDPATKGQTFISYLHHARNRILDTLKAGSEHSLVMALQAHPQIYMYLPNCPGEQVEGKPPSACANGKNMATGATCTRCKGSGKSIPTSVLDVMVFDLPDDFPNTQSQVPGLDKLKHTFAPAVDIITVLRDHLRDLEDQCIRDIFTSLQHQRGKVTATATEVNAETEAMNDSLHPYARKVSTAKTVLVYCSAAFVDADKDLEYTHKFPEDFRLAPLGSLLDDLTKAVNTASPFTVELLEDDVVAKKLRDRPLELRQYQVKKQFRPLAHLSSSERASAMASEDFAPTDRILLLYENEIYREVGKSDDFWYKEMDAQKKLIDAEVEKIIQRIRSEKVIEVDFKSELETEIEGEEKKQEEGIAA